MNHPPQPTMTCPRCGAEFDDFDGLGVVAHIAPMPDPCGYCVHPARDRDPETREWVCGICGDRRPDWTRRRGDTEMTDAERLRAVAEVIGTWLHNPVPSNAELVTRIRALLDDGAYAASRFVSPAPGVTLGAITPEASALIDEILAAWDAHAPNVRPNNDLIGVTTPDRETLYGFVYWLCRWSGLVRPVRTILDDVPSVEWHTQSNGDKYAELDGGWKLLTQQCDDGGYSVTARRGTDLSASEWHIPYRDSAQRRALALYVALRGVT